MRFCLLPPHSGRGANRSARLHVAIKSACPRTCIGFQMPSLCRVLGTSIRPPACLGSAEKRSTCRARLPLRCYRVFRLPPLLQRFCHVSRTSTVRTHLAALPRLPPFKGNCIRAVVFFRCGVSLLLRCTGDRAIPWSQALPHPALLHQPCPANVHAQVWVPSRSCLREPKGLDAMPPMGFSPAGLERSGKAGPTHQVSCMATAAGSWLRQAAGSTLVARSLLFHALLVNRAESATHPLLASFSRFTNPIKLDPKEMP